VAISNAAAFEPRQSREADMRIVADRLIRRITAPAACNALDERSGDRVINFYQHESALITIFGLVPNAVHPETCMGTFCNHLTWSLLNEIFEGAQHA
jgi:hypothetical protein